MCNPNRRYQALAILLMAGLVMTLLMVAASFGQPPATFAQAQPTTPAPFLYPPFLGLATRASSIFDHTEPLYLRGQATEHRYRVTTFNGTQVACATHTHRRPPLPRRKIFRARIARSTMTGTTALTTSSGINP